MSYIDSSVEANRIVGAVDSSSIKASPARKERKFAFVTNRGVDAGGMEKLDREGEKVKGNGVNIIPNGKQRTLGETKEVEVKSEKQSEGEIELDLGVEEEMVRQNEQPIIRGPQHNTMKSVNARQDAEARINNILTRCRAPPGSAASSYPPFRRSSAYSSKKHQTRYSNRLLARDVQPANTRLVDMGMDRRSTTARIASHTAHGRGRGKDNPRYHYDLSFTDNPWVELAKALSPRGVSTWPQKIKKQDV